MNDEPPQEQFLKIGITGYDTSISVAVLPAIMWEQLGVTEAYV